MHAPIIMCSALQLWFTTVLRDGLATGASGAFAPFKDIGVYHLQGMMTKAGLSGDHNEAVQTVLSGFEDAECRDDIGPAFKRVHAKGIKVTCPKQRNSLEYVCPYATEVCEGEKRW